MQQFNVFNSDKDANDDKNQKFKVQERVIVVLLAIIILYTIITIVLTAYVFANFAKNGLYVSLLTMAAAYVSDMVV